MFGLELIGKHIRFQDCWNLAVSIWENVALPALVLLLVQSSPLWLYILVSCTLLQTSAVCKIEVFNDFENMKYKVCVSSDVGWSQGGEDSDSTDEASLSSPGTPDIVM